MGDLISYAILDGWVGANRSDAELQRRQKIFSSRYHVIIIGDNQKRQGKGLTDSSAFSTPVSIC